MDFQRKIFSTTVVVFLLLTLQISASAKDQWIQVKSKNFTLIGNAREKKVRDVATKLEQFRYVFTRLFPKMNFQSPIPTSVVVFKSKRSFKPYKSIKWAAGYFQPGDDINYIALHTGGAKEQLYSTIFHEYVHFLTNNNIGKSRLPAWFSEGIAEYYDQFKIKKDQVITLGGLNNNHLRFLQRTKLIPLETFFNIDHFSLNRAGSHSASIFYSQSWALIHYLIQGNGGRRNSELALFLNLITDGKEPKDAFALAFKSDYKRMEKELRKYVRRSRYKVTTVTFKKKLLFEDQMQTTPLSESASKAHLGDLLFRIRKYPEAERRLNESLTLDPKQGFANATMGMLKIKQNKYSEAKDYLQKAVSSGETNYRIYYQYAYVLSHEGRAKGSVMDKFSSVTADEMRNALKKAISLNPSFPRSYDLMARVSLITGENLDEGIEYLLKAIKLSPGNQFYRLNLANLYLRKREISKAIPIVETVHKTADEPQLRSYAARLLEDLKRIKNQIERFKNQGNIDRDDERSVSRTRERDNSRPPRLGRRTRPNVATDQESAMTDGERGTLALNRALREVQDGEERFLGYLSGISCKNGGVVYLVKRDNNMLLLRSKDFQKLELTMINVDLGNLEIGCGSIKKDMLAVITYRPNGKPKTKVVGEMISIEFVPANFKIMKVEER